MKKATLNEMAAAMISSGMKLGELGKGETALALIAWHRVNDGADSIDVTERFSTGHFSDEEKALKAFTKWIHAVFANVGEKGGMYSGEDK